MITSPLPASAAVSKASSIPTSSSREAISSRASASASACPSRSANNNNELARLHQKAEVVERPHHLVADVKRARHMLKCNHCRHALIISYQSLPQCDYPAGFEQSTGKIIDTNTYVLYSIFMRSPASGENAKPWIPSSPAEAALDIVTLGATRRERERRVRAHYASLDEDRLRGYVTSHEVTPRPLSNLLPSARAKGIAQLALAVVYSAKTIHINTFQ